MQSEFRAGSGRSSGSSAGSASPGNATDAAARGATSAGRKGRAVPARTTARRILYDAADVRVIIRDYYETAKAVGLDPLLVVSQMVLETGGLSSFWSQRPRRNPAGIGVTGEPGAGLSFPDWKTAVRAHTGRLLAYSLPSGRETQAQRELITDALTHRPLPQRFRGVAPTLEGLAGTWAADPQYAVKLARVANEIRTQSI